MRGQLRVLIWVGISFLGAIAVGFSAFHRGEHINALWLVVAGLCTFAKIFSKDPALGFLAGTRFYAQKISEGASEKDIAIWQKVIHMNHVDVAVTGFFPVAVAVIVAGCVWEWACLLAGRKQIVLRESPYVSLPDPA